MSVDLIIRPSLSFMTAPSWQNKIEGSKKWRISRLWLDSPLKNGIRLRCRIGANPPIEFPRLRDELEQRFEIRRRRRHPDGCLLQQRVRPSRLPRLILRAVLPQPRIFVVEVRFVFPFLSKVTKVPVTMSPLCQDQVESPIPLYAASHLLCFYLCLALTLCCVPFLCSSHLFQQGMPLSRSNRRGTGPVMPEDLQLPKPEMLSSVPSSRNGLASTVNRTFLTFNRTDSRTNTAPGDKSQSVPPGAPTVRDSSEPFSCIQLIYVVARLEALFCMFCWGKRRARGTA